MKNRETKESGLSRKKEDTGPDPLPTYPWNSLLLLFAAGPGTGCPSSLLFPPFFRLYQVFRGFFVPLLFK